MKQLSTLETCCNLKDNKEDNYQKPNIELTVEVVFLIPIIWYTRQICFRLNWYIALVLVRARFGWHNS